MDTYIHPTKSLQETVLSLLGLRGEDSPRGDTQGYFTL
jgi:hypothetical protein